LSKIGYSSSLDTVSFVAPQIRENVQLPESPSKHQRHRSYNEPQANFLYASKSLSASADSLAALVNEGSQLVDVPGTPGTPGTPGSPGSPRKLFKSSSSDEAKSSQGSNSEFVGQEAKRKPTGLLGFLKKGKKEKEEIVTVVNPLKKIQEETKVKPKPVRHSQQLLPQEPQIQSLQAQIDQMEADSKKRAIIREARRKQREVEMQKEVEEAMKRQQSRDTRRQSDQQKLLEASQNLEKTQSRLHSIGNPL
jgi:hypothetical protein